VRLRVRGWGIAFVLSLATSVSAIDYNNFETRTREFDLAGKLQYYIEEYNAQQPHEALELLQKGYFSRAEGEQLSLGYT